MVRDLTAWERMEKIMLKDRNTSRLIELTTKSHKNSLVFVFNMGVYYDSIETFTEKLKKFNNAIARMNVLIVAVRGSDDNPELFKDKYWDALSNIKLVEDYTVLNLCDDNCALVIGGDISLDKKWKVSQGRYWEKEEPVFDHTRIKSPIELGYNINTLITSSRLLQSPEYSFGPWVNEFETDMVFKLFDVWSEASKLMEKMLLLGHNLKHVMTREPVPRLNFGTRETVLLNDYRDVGLGKFVDWD